MAKKDWTGESCEKWGVNLHRTHGRQTNAPEAGLPGRADQPQSFTRIVQHYFESGEALNCETPDEILAKISLLIVLSRIAQR